MNLILWVVSQQEQISTFGVMLLMVLLKSKYLNYTKMST